MNMDKYDRVVEALNRLDGSLLHRKFKEAGLLDNDQE